MTNLKLAVVGAGHLGRIHARLIKEMSDVDLVAVVDPLAAARERVATDCHTQPHADHRELLSRVDAAVIATPTRFHHGVALDFLQAGIPLLIEKPLAADVGEADELVMAAAARDVALQVGHIERFNPALEAARPHLGQPKYIEAVRASGFTGRSTDIGVVLDLMIHDIDVVLSLVDSPLESVAAMGLSVLGRREDVAQARLTFANGCVANLSASRISFSATPRRQMQIWSDRGFAAIDFGNREASVVAPSEAVTRHEIDFDSLSFEEKTDLKERLFTDVLRLQPLAVESCNALANELRDFVDSVRYGRTPRVTGQQGREAVAVADAILQAIRVHRWQGREMGPIGPLAMPAAAGLLRGPHWQGVAQPRPAA